MRKENAVVSSVLFLVLVLSVFMSIALLIGRIPQETAPFYDGYSDLSGFDFDNKLACIPHSNFYYYRNELYTPEDFMQKELINKPVSLIKYKGRFDPGEYGTYRIVLKLPPGRIYGITSYSAMYSQRLFINGAQYPDFGTPGTTAKMTIPKTGHYTFYFKPDKEQTEIIIQFANYNHADYGGIVDLYVGSQEKITERDSIALMCINILVGCMLTAFLLFMGMFLFFRKRYAFLWFSLACLAIGLRTLLVNEKVIMLLLPNLPWRAALGMEYLSLVLLLISFLLYMNSMLPGAISKFIIQAYIVVSGAYALLIVFFPPRIYTTFILYYQLSAIPLGGYVTAALIYSIIRHKDNRLPEQALIGIGAFGFIVLSILDIWLHRSSGYSLIYSLTETGMLVLVFMSMIALSLQFARVEMELNRARSKEQEMQETNRLLDSMGRLKSDFMANISHEMRTPLTVMASYAGLTAMQLRHNATDEKTLDNLSVIKREAVRLANLVEQMKDLSVERERQLTLSKVNAEILMQQAADFCIPICLKNKNRITVDHPGETIYLNINREGIFQALVNLIINANRHTKEGIISLTAKKALAPEEGSLATITVSDDGDGIDPQLLPRLFQRGVSGDGSSGLGLSICKEIIEEHGGRIWIESEMGKGTTIFLTLPYEKGDDAN